MRYKILYGIFALMFITVSMQVNVTAKSRFDNTPAEDIYPQSNTAKLYQILKNIDDDENWLQASELLREVLETDLPDPFVRNQLTLAKDEIDSEQFWKNFRSRVQAWPFVVAKLRIIEAMMAMHPTFNVSYDRELHLVKKLLHTFFFPGEEHEGAIEDKIVFPKPKTYGFDLYGYVTKNVLQTETARSWEEEDPRFPEDGKKRRRGTRPTRSSRTGRLPGESDPFEKDLRAFREGLDKVGSLIGATSKDIEELVNITKRQNIYEPWALLLTSVSNPDAVNYDPQLRDFLTGVKLRLKIGDGPLNPAAQELLAEALGEKEADTGLRIQQGIESTTGRVVYYAVSNLTNAHSFISMRFFIYLKKFINYHTTPEHRFSAAMVAQMARLLDRLARWDIPKAGAHPFVYFPSVWLKNFGKLANFMVGTESIILKFGRSERFKAIWTKIQNNWFVKKNPKFLNESPYFMIAMGLAIASDAAEGVVGYMAARDKYDTVDVTKKLISEELGTEIYMLPLITDRAIGRYMGLIALGLDVGHMISAKIPRTADVIDWILFEFVGDTVMGWSEYVGMKGTFDHRLVLEYEKKFEIEEGTSKKAIDDFKEVVDESEDEADLVMAFESFSFRMKEYANKRLFMIYYLHSRWNNREEYELGRLEDKYLDDYLAYHDDLVHVRSLYDKKMERLSQGAVEEAEERRDLRREIRDEIEEDGNEPEVGEGEEGEEERKLNRLERRRVIRRPVRRPTPVVPIEEDDALEEEPVKDPLEPPAKTPPVVEPPVEKPPTEDSKAPVEESPVEKPPVEEASEDVVEEGAEDSRVAPEAPAEEEVEEEEATSETE